ncbi:MAG: hypothetical protein WCP60_09075 [bacterium]
MYRPLAIILTTGAIALSGMTAWIITSVVRENRSEGVSYAIPRERKDASSRSALSSLPSGSSLVSLQSNTIPKASVAGSPSFTRSSGGGQNDASPSTATAYHSLPNTAPYTATPAMVSGYQPVTLASTMQSPVTQQSVTSSRPSSSAGYSTPAVFSAQTATATAITSPSVPAVTTTPLDPSAPGNSITADGNLVSVDGVQQSSSSSDLSLAVSPGSGSSTKTSGHTRSGPSEDELFRGKWGWAAYDLAKRIAKGLSTQ